ncbi:MAG: Isochorismate synthase MenF [Chlamydiia bacterium]|nr:Isochorismate synthase MenF [Chlamydiia bacterium]
MSIHAASKKLLETTPTNEQLWTYKLNDQDLSFYKIETTFKFEDPIDWLSSQSLYPLLLWKNKEGNKTHIALSSMYSCDSVPKIECKKRGLGHFPQLFGGCYFSKDITSYNIWNNFTKPGFFLPEVELQLDNKGICTISLHILKNQENITKHIESLLERLKFTTKSVKSFESNFMDRVDLPNYTNWCTLVQKALDTFDRTPLQKVVLSRSSYFSFRENVDPFEVLKKLSDSALNSTLFAWIPCKDTAFLGATPEKLYTREGRNISTEAVAGTRPRGQTEHEDHSLCEELKHNNKEAREFTFVSHFFDKALPKLCESYSRDDKTKVSKTSTVQHLYDSFTGLLKEEYSDKDLIETFHPTPAMGGTPTDLALTFIQENELFFRGYYASPLGWISPEKSEFFVGIRSAFIQKTRLVLFSGGGIVNGSDPTKEWEELDYKISQFISNKKAYAKRESISYPKVGRDNYSRIATS